MPLDADYGDLTLLDRHLIRHHGIGTPKQFAWYRCEGCRRLVTWKRIRGYPGFPKDAPATRDELSRAGGCSCGSNRLRPTNPSLWEKIRLVLFPGSV